MKKKTIFKCQRGASAVEFAIILPLLLAFVFGIIEFGILLYNKAVITNASREGARTAILFNWDPNSEDEEEGRIPTPDAVVQTAVLNYCADYLINFSDSKIPEVSVTPPVVSGTPPTRYRTVTVTLNYNFLILPNILAVFSSGGTMEGEIPLTAVTRMRSEDQAA